MPRYSVIITRDVTESTRVEVEAETPQQAETRAFEKLFNSTDTEWELDEGSWNKADAYVTAALKTHPQWSQTDFEYFRGKGYSNQQILEFWERDLRLGCKPLNWKPTVPCWWPSAIVPAMCCAAPTSMPASSMCAATPSGCWWSIPSSRPMPPTRTATTR
ncbi:conserved hypothetical protein [Magnetospirillum sp. SS-4]|nr:conserved hypothetical protein [Magnetospirillum sp. SS-4]